MQYIGREKELHSLRSLRESSEAELAILYGRRRVGKSSLVKEAYKSEKLFCFEGLEEATEKEQLENFHAQLIDYFPTIEKNPAKDWYQALSNLNEQIKNLNCVVLLDELQWLANYKGKLISVLKQIWDQKFSRNPRLTLVLCGSVASFMVNKVLKSKALYGRASTNIHLLPFKIRETGLFLAGRSSEEILQAHILVGGIPGYLNKLRQHNSIILGIQQMAFEHHGYLKNEYERIFISQFGKNENYEKIVRYLASHSHGLSRSQLANFEDLSNGGSFSTCLADLETAGIISSYFSFEKNPASKKRIYLLSDPYCRLYLAFIEKNLDRIDSGVPNIFTNLVKSPTFSSWMGIGAELLCYNHKHELAKLMGFSDIIYQAGPYLSRKSKVQENNLQIDLVYLRNDSVLTVCEIKYGSNLGIELIEEIKQKIDKLTNYSGKTIQAALIYRTPPSKDLVNSAYFNHLIALEDLIKVSI